MKALICGSFDPITNGHVDLIRRTSVLFDDVTVCIFVNSAKKYMFPAADKKLREIMQMILQKTHPNARKFCYNQNAESKRIPKETY